MHSSRLLLFNIMNLIQVPYVLIVYYFFCLSSSSCVTMSHVCNLPVNGHSDYFQLGDYVCIDLKKKNQWTHFQVVSIMRASRGQSFIFSGDTSYGSWKCCYGDMY